MWDKSHHSRRWEEGCPGQWGCHLSLLYCIGSSLFMLAGMSLIQMCWTLKSLWAVTNHPEFVLCKDMTSLAVFGNQWLSQPERLARKTSFHCSERNVHTQIMYWSWASSRCQKGHCVAHPTSQGHEMQGEVFSRGYRLTHAKYCRGEVTVALGTTGARNSHSIGTLSLYL